MHPKFLFVVSSDPRVSHRPAEAIRIAAGVGAWEAAQIKVYLHGPAVLLLEEEDEVKKHLGMIGESKVFVDTTISSRQLAELAGESDYVLHF